MKILNLNSFIRGLVSLFASGIRIQFLWSKIKTFLVQSVLLLTNASKNNIFV